MFFSCSENKKETPAISIQWNGNRAESIFIPGEWLHGIPNDSISQLLHIQLVKANTPILGEYTSKDSGITFQPLVAFTRGLKYEVRLRNKIISNLLISPADPRDASKVIAVYPSGDTLPLNLLKFYIVFSQPMQEGRALENIVLIKKPGDTIASVFLDLQPELWNKERTMLTLWLDPGRIKRDLQPNIKMGPPLQPGASYQLIVKRNWRDAEGLPVLADFQKDFVVGLRDSHSPDPDHWTNSPPQVGTREPLKVTLHESLDYVLLKNAIRIVDKKGSIIGGVLETAAEETVFIFTPSVIWNPGEYIIEIESRLEDLAGNNLDRLFDREITASDSIKWERVYKSTFLIQGIRTNRKPVRN